MISILHTSACVALCALASLSGLAARPAVAADDLAMVSTCFVPRQDCEAEIVARIATAAHSIRVQAYGFSDPRIIGALTDAARRGVDVQIIVDRSNVERRHVVVDELVRGGIPVWVDGISGIAHTKAIIIDQDWVIGGSYNYTLAAQRRNAENVVFLHGQAVARHFLDNWNDRRDDSATRVPDP